MQVFTVLIRKLYYLIGFTHAVGDESRIQLRLFFLCVLRLSCNRFFLVI